VLLLATQHAHTHLPESIPHNSPHMTIHNNNHRQNHPIGSTLGSRSSRFSQFSVLGSEGSHSSYASDIDPSRRVRRSYRPRRKDTSTTTECSYPKTIAHSTITGTSRIYSDGFTHTGTCLGSRSSRLSQFSVLGSEGRHSSYARDIDPSRRVRRSYRPRRKDTSTTTECSTIQGSTWMDSLTLEHALGSRSSRLSQFSVLGSERSHSSYAHDIDPYVEKIPAPLLNVRTQKRLHTSKKFDVVVVVSSMRINEP
jgi:hypothetical protein